MRVLPYLLAAGLLIPASPLVAQHFEGEIRQRTINLEAGAIESLLYGDGDEPDVEDESEAAWLRRMAARLFELPVERLLAAAREDGEVEDITAYVKGNKLRAGGSVGDGPAFWVLVDLDAQTITMVNEQERYFIRMTHEDYARDVEALTGPPPADEEGAGLMIRPLNRRATVAGVPCQGYEVTGEEGELTWGWVSDAYPGLLATFQDYGRRMEQIFSEVGDDGPSPEDALYERGLPMRVQHVRGGGMFESYSVDEILSIEEKPVPDAMFAVPAGFTQKTLREVWGR